MMLDWKRMSGDRWCAEAPVGDGCYEVFASYVAFTCDSHHAYDGDWSSDALASYEDAYGELVSRARAGRFAFIGSDGPVELFRVREGLDACMGDGRGLAIACDWQVYLDGEQLDFYGSAEDAMRSAEQDAARRFVAGF